MYEVVARHSGKCADVAAVSPDDGARLQQWSCHGGANQQWRIEPVAGGYSRLVAQHSGKCLDVSEWSLEEGVQLQQWACTEGENQQWSLQSTTDGYVSVISRHSGLALDVYGESQEDGASIVQFSPNGGANQQWLLRPAAGGPGGPPPESMPATADVVRLLEQATFGPTPSLISHVKEVGFERFLDEQFNAAPSSYPSLPLYPTTRDPVACPANSTCQRDNYTMYLLQNRFYTNAFYAEDQLRQRVAFALHQIIVVSGVEITQPSWMAPYLQILDRHAFGNFRQLLYDISRNPAMGNYLDINGNTRTRPNENYAREILQLFSLGTVLLNSDGTPRVGDDGQPIPSFTQATVNNFARVFTGWRLAPAPLPGVPNYIDPMVPNEPQHDVGAKTLLNGAILPSGQGTAQDLNDALDNIFWHPNVGPFIGRQLIQHLVTSNPSRAYVARVSAVFDGGGTGNRGDLRAVVKAILLDPEARGDRKTDPAYGRLRHPPQLVANVLRALNVRSADGRGESDGYLNPQNSAMGMDIFRPPSVFSYFSPAGTVPGSGGVRGPEFAIFTTSTAVSRINFVNTMVFLRIAVSANAPNGTAIDVSTLLPLAARPLDLIAALDELLMHGTMSAAMRDHIAKAVLAVAGSNPLKRVRTALYLVLTSSQYQVEK
ncbi:MAG: DUF1800 family protein [Vicinamibacterales bacterium]